MRRHIMFGLACLCTACAGHVKSPPVAIGLEIHTDDKTLWQNAVKTVHDNLPGYLVYEAETHQNLSVLDSINKKDGSTHACLAPRTVYDSHGNIERFIPLTCGQLNNHDPVSSLKQLIQNAEKRSIKPDQTISPAVFRQTVLEMSSPEDPVCFGVFPDLFASYIGDISISLVESYLIACASRIHGENNMVPSKKLAEWTTENAALLSTNTSFIRSAFDMAVSDCSYEGMSYGSALEAHVEMLSRKLLQSEVTSLSSLSQSDKAKNDFVSRQNIERLLYGLSAAESMTGDRMEAVIRAMAPVDDETRPFQQLRRIVQIRACQMAVMVPETKPSLASACMPWLELSLQNEDEFGSALMLIAHGMDNANHGEAPVAPDILAWLKTFTTDNPKIDEDRKIFLHRIPSMNEK